MRAHLYSAVTVLALAATMGVAVAADAGSAMKSDSGKDALALTTAQRHEIYRDVSRQRMSEATPSGFAAKVGEAVPNSLKLHPLPATVTHKVAAVRSDDYAMLRNKTVLIVDPSSKTIADIITQ